MSATAAAAAAAAGCSKQLRQTTELHCNSGAECPGYNTSASNPRPRRVKVQSVVKNSLFCHNCRHAYCRVCMPLHNHEQCANASKSPGPYTWEQLHLAVSCACAAGDNSALVTVQPEDMCCW